MVVSSTKFRSGGYMLLKYKFIKALTTKLFEPDRRRLGVGIAEIIARNKQIKNITLDTFIYSVRRYQPLTGSILVPAKGEAMPTLDKSLQAAMMAYLDDERAVEIEELEISQMLYRLIRDCNQAKDYRDALPECLVGCVPEFKNYSRGKAAAYTLEGCERDKRQYQKLLPKIEAYSVAGFIY